MRQLVIALLPLFCLSGCASQSTAATPTSQPGGAPPVTADAARTISANAVLAHTDSVAATSAEADALRTAAHDPGAIDKALKDLRGQGGVPGGPPPHPSETGGMFVKTISLVQLRKAVADKDYAVFDETPSQLGLWPLTRGAGTGSSPIASMVMGKVGSAYDVAYTAPQNSMAVKAEQARQRSVSEGVSSASAGRPPFVLQIPELTERVPFLAVSYDATFRLMAVDNIHQLQISRFSWLSVPELVERLEDAKRRAKESIKIEKDKRPAPGS